MATSRTGAHGSGALESLAGELARDAGSFTPEVEPHSESHGSLPGRRRGATAPKVERPTGAAAVLIDIGTSRRGGFTHVFWVSPSAESLLGSEAFDRLGARLSDLAGIEEVAWEGLDHLHAKAPGRDHAELLSEARAAVESLLG